MRKFVLWRSTARSSLRAVLVWRHRNRISNSSWRTTPRHPVKSLVSSLKSIRLRQRPPPTDAAIALAKKENAVLVVSKLDRLSRRVSFLASLMEEKGLDFKVAAMPYADRFQLHICAALAEQEKSSFPAEVRQHWPARQEVPSGHNSPIRHWRKRRSRRH